jgi:hypothetical protein
MKKSASATPETDAQSGTRASQAKAPETLARIEQKYGKRKELSEDELESRWRHLMQSGKFIYEN